MQTPSNNEYSNQKIGGICDMTQNNVVTPITSANNGNTSSEQPVTLRQIIIGIEDNYEKSIKTLLEGVKPEEKRLATILNEIVAHPTKFGELIASINAAGRGDSDILQKIDAQLDGKPGTAVWKLATFIYGCPSFLRATTDTDPDPVFSRLKSEIHTCVLTHGATLPSFMAYETKQMNATNSTSSAITTELQADKKSSSSSSSSPSSGSSTLNINQGQYANSMTFFQVAQPEDTNKQSTRGWCSIL